MINKSKLALIAALVAMSAASPALAQAFSKGDGTGNNLPFTYGQNGTSPLGLSLPRTAKLPPGRAMPARLPLIRTARPDLPVPTRSTGCNEGFLETETSTKTGAGFPPVFARSLSRRPFGTNGCRV